MMRMSHWADRPESVYPRMESYRRMTGDLPWRFTELGYIEVRSDIHRQKLKREGYEFTADKVARSPLPNPLTGCTV